MEYKLKCDRGKVKTGTPYVYQNSDGTNILNFPTKEHWRFNGKRNDKKGQIKKIWRI